MRIHYFSCWTKYACIAIDRDRMLGYIVRIMRSMLTNAGRGIHGRWKKKVLYRSNVNNVKNLHVFKDSFQFLGGLKSGKKDSAQRAW